MDPDRITRDDPAWAATSRERCDPVQGTGAWRRLLPAIAEDVATQPLLTPGELRAISAPTLVACGDRDPLVPVGQAWDLARAVARRAPVRRTRRRSRRPDPAAGPRARGPRGPSIVRPSRSLASEPRDAAAEVSPMTTLLALYRRPEGGPDARAIFERRYTAEHLPLVAGTPGLRVDARPAGDRGARWRDRPHPRHGDGLRRPGGARRRSRRRTPCAPPGRNLREIAPGLATLLVLEDVAGDDAAASPRRGYCRNHQPRKPSDRRRAAADARRARPRPERARRVRRVSPSRHRRPPRPPRDARSPASRSSPSTAPRRSTR